MNLEEMRLEIERLKANARDAKERLSELEHRFDDLVSKLAFFEQENAPTVPSFDITFDEPL